MSKRNAARFGETESESTIFAVQRYGKIKPETLAEIVAWLKSQGDAYNWEVGQEYIAGHTPHPIIKTQRKGSAIYKIIDNEHDAQNSLANIRNKGWPKNKQGQ